MTPKDLRSEIERLLKANLADAELRALLEELANRERAFAGYTWIWGPELYRRNRILFRPFILARFSRFMVLPKWKVEVITFKKHRDVLQPWMDEADQRDDAELFRKLYEWQLDGRFTWALRDERSRELNSVLRKRFSVSKNFAECQITLRKFDLWFTLDEETAVQIYRAEPNAAGDYILRHLPNPWYLGDKGRKLWQKLFNAARERNDDFAWKLYRRQVPHDQWQADIIRLASEIQDTAALSAELKKRHIEGWNINLTSGMLELLKRRGRDVFPYVTPHLGSVRRGFIFQTKDYRGILDLAEKQEWWDLWSGIKRSTGTRGEFSGAVDRWLSSNLPEEQKRERLLALAGVSREWNLPGLGLAATHQLEEKTALNLYEKFPDLVRGAFRQHILPHRWGEAFPHLLDRFLALEDEEMIDLAASRFATVFGARWSGVKAHLSHASKLADYYLGLKGDENLFSRRAARVMGHIPAFSIYSYGVLIRENRLARLLFERSITSFLGDKSALLDLVEASEIHVQELAYRVLAQNDPRAREVALEQLPLLLGTLLRPLHRATRSAAFGALANAAQSPEAARIVLQRAREAFVLPDDKYPKERLLGLVASILKQHPELRGPAEHPVVYERVAA